MQTRLCHPGKAHIWMVLFFGVFVFLTSFCHCLQASAGDCSERLLKASSLLSQQPDQAESGVSSANVEKSLKILKDISSEEPQLEAALKPIGSAIENALKEKGEKRQELLESSSQKILSLSRLTEQNKTSESDRSGQLSTLKSVVDSVTGENPAQRFMRELREAVIRFLESILGKIPGKQRIGLGEMIFIISIVMLCSLLVAVFAIIIYYIVSSSLSRMSQKRPGSRADKGRALTMLNEEQLLEKASMQAGKENFTEALRLVCQAMIALLIKNRLVSHREGKTNREYVQELSAKKNPEITDSFRASTASHEKNWYGKNKATREDYDSVMSDFQHISEEIRHNQGV